MEPRRTTANSVTSLTAEKSPNALLRPSVTRMKSPLRPRRSPPSRSALPSGDPFSPFGLQPQLPPGSLAEVRAPCIPNFGAPPATFDFRSQRESGMLRLPYYVGGAPS